MKFKVACWALFFANSLSPSLSHDIEGEDHFSFGALSLDRQQPFDLRSSWRISTSVSHYFDDDYESDSANTLRLSYQGVDKFNSSLSMIYRLQATHRFNYDDKTDSYFGLYGAFGPRFTFEKAHQVDLPFTISNAKFYEDTGNGDYIRYGFSPEVRMPVFDNARFRLRGDIEYTAYDTALNRDELTVRIRPSWAVHGDGPYSYNFGLSLERRKSEQDRYTQTRGGAHFSLTRELEKNDASWTIYASHNSSRYDEGSTPVSDGERTDTTLLEISYDTPLPFAERAEAELGLGYERNYRHLADTTTQSPYIFLNLSKRF